MSETEAKAGPPPVMRVVRTRESLDDAYASLPVPSVRSARAARAAVFTMGALHEGHVALIRAARGEVGPTGHVTVTVFVNPLQFGAGEDLERYPRTLKADLEICAAEDVDLVFAPAADVLYPTGDPEVRIDPGQMGSILEGAVRPGHFAGVLTVVMKLLHMTRPDATFFGEKDYQQLTLMRRMVGRPRPAGEGPRGPHRPRGRRAGPLEPQPLPLRGGARPGRCRPRGPGSRCDGR